MPNSLTKKVKEFQLANVRRRAFAMREAIIDGNANVYVLKKYKYACSSVE